LVISEPQPEYQGPSGFIDAQLLKTVHPDVSAAMFYLCGPEAMYAYCLSELEKLGILRRRIRTEVFGPPKDVTAQPGWPADIKAEERFAVAVKRKGALQARAGEPLMVAFERAGIVLPALCRSGECSLCRTKLLRGRVFQPAGVKLRKSDRESGYIHPCLAYPLSDLELML